MVVVPAAPEGTAKGKAHQVGRLEVSIGPCLAKGSDGNHDELRAQFLPEFTTGTRTRLRTAISLIPPIGPGGEQSAQSIVAMMHTIAGEAMLMGYPELAQLARAAGESARGYLKTRDDLKLVACVRAGGARRPRLTVRDAAYVLAVEKAILRSVERPGTVVDFRAFLDESGAAFLLAGRG